MWASRCCVGEDGSVIGKVIIGTQTTDVEMSDIIVS